MLPRCTFRRNTVGDKSRGRPEKPGMAGYATQAVRVFVVHFTHEKALSPRTVFRSGDSPRDGRQAFRGRVGSVGTSNRKIPTCRQMPEAGIAETRWSNGSS